MPDENEDVNQTPQRVPWTALEILLGLYLVWLFWPYLMQTLVEGLHLERWYYGDDTSELSKRLELWSTTLAAPFEVLTFPLIFAVFSKTRLEQLGLTTRRLGRNVLLGLAGLLVLAPLVLGVYQLVRFLYEKAGQEQYEPHALEIIARQHLYPSEWVMFFFSAMIAAPLLEEIIFRGVLQPWLAARRWGGHLAMLGALALALLYRQEQMLAAWRQDVASLLEATTPALFVLALVPVYLLVWRFSRTPVPPAIFGTSFLFACFHRWWPTPVPLFVLALGLGVLAQRTRSLVGPIVLHSLFNGISCVQLLLERS
jgi:membrane protease YdiL (CAAX protease family)